MDDDEDLLILLSKAFLRWKFTGIFKQTVEEALAYAGSRLPSLVLCDLKMAGNGHVFAKRFRQIDGAKDVMLIAITDYEKEYGLEYSRKAGFDGCVHKTRDVDLMYAQLKVFVRMFL